MLDQLRQRMADEVETLVHELNVILPKGIEKAVAQGDLRENAEYSAALERQRFVQARLNYLMGRIARLGELDTAHVPGDRIGFGSKVTVRDEDDGQIESFVLTLGDEMDVASDEVSIESPLGQALMGQKSGDAVAVELPTGERWLEVVSFTTIHDDIAS